MPLLVFPATSPVHTRRIKFLQSGTLRRILEQFQLEKLSPLSTQRPMVGGLGREGFSMETLLGNVEWLIVNGEIWTSNAAVGLPSNVSRSYPSN